MTGGISLGKIVAEITANTAGLKRGAADAERILNDTSNNASAAGKTIGTAFAGTAAAGVVKLTDKLKDCTNVAIDNKKTLTGLESVAKDYGVSIEDATKATKDFTQDGLLQMKSAITANTAGLKKGQIEASKSFSDISKGGINTGKIVAGAFGVAAAAGVMKLIDKFQECAQIAIDNKKALMGLESVAKAYGVSAEDATKATKDFTQDGLLQMKSATIGMKNIISTGFNITEAMNLSKALKDIGAFNNVTGDLGQAYEDVTKGMRTGSIELIENIGLTQKLSAVMKAANIDVSNGIDLTNNAAQREAFYNMVLKEGEKFKGNAAKLANDQASSQDKANAAMKEAADAIGNRLLPVYSNLMGAVADISKGLTSIFSKNRIDEANEYAEAVKKQKTEFDELSITYTRLSANQNKTKEETKVYKDTIAELKKQYPEFLENIDMEKEGYNGVATALAKINEQLNKKLLFSMKEKEMAKEQQRIIDAETKKYDATLNYNKALSKQQALINELSKKKEKLVTGRYVTTENGFEYAKFTEKDMKNDKEIKYINGEYVKKMLVAEDEAAARIEREKLRGIKEGFKKEVEGYDAEKADATNKIIEITKKYDTIAGVTKESLEGAKKENDGDNGTGGTGTGGTGGKYSLDASETTKQKLIEQEYKYKVDLANAKEEEKWRVELENKKAVAIINATAEAEKKIAAIRKKVESSQLSEKAGRKQAVAINEQLAKDIGIFELSEATATNKAEKAYEKFGKALGLLDINNYIDPEHLELEITIEPVFTQENKKYSARDKLFGYGEGHFNPAVGLTDPSKHQTTFAQQGTGGEVKKEAEYVNKSLDDVTKSFSELAGVLDNEVVSAISNIANEAMSMKGNISGFSAAQGAGDMLGMLSSGIGIFSSAVSIFSMVGGLFSKSTYNFDEAVKKMLAGIGEKTPNLQVAEYEKAMGIQAYLESIGKNWKNSIFTENEIKKLTELGANTTGGQMQEGYMGFIASDTRELLANLEAIIPQLAGQLGTAAGDFGSAIGSALSSATTSEELKANLYDSIYGTVKSGLINAFLAGEVMKPLLENLQQTVTLAVANGGIDASEKTAIQGLLGEVNTEADKFYAALEEVGLNVVDAAGQLNEAADRMDNVNRNLRLADRISTITTQTSTAGITQLAGNSSIVYDFSNANLGGMTEQQVISAVSKANRMASIRKVGV